MTSAIPVQCSTNWSIKPSGSWSHFEFVIYPGRGWRMQMSRWNIIYLNCRERYEFMIDLRSYTNNLQSWQAVRQIPDLSAWTPKWFFPIYGLKGVLITYKTTLTGSLAGYLRILVFWGRVRFGQQPSRKLCCLQGFKGSLLHRRGCSRANN